MKLFLRSLICLFFLTLLLAAGLGVFSLQMMKQPGPLAVEKTIVMRKGMRSQEIVALLGQEGVIRFPYLFYAVQFARGEARKFKAGEYRFAAAVTPEEVAGKLVRGEVVLHQITIPEGWNIRDIRAALMADPLLEGEITQPMAEGSILPESYHYLRGDRRDMVIVRMQKAMEQLLAELWERRAPNLPLATKEEALILASIVEKETGLPEERPHIAGVFINRLRKGMRLQTDPSVVYGIEQKLGAPMGRVLTRADLEIPTAYNSYIIAGLPPTPIANPGRAALEAVLHPMETDDLYFVATGHGGHNFAKTLEAHNKNVAAYRSALGNAE